MTVATRTGLFDVSTPPGTALATPQSTPIVLGDSLLSKVTIRVPAGHCGTTGIQVVFNGTVIVPWENDNTWLVADNEEIEALVGTEVDQQLTVNTYNTDIWQHTHYMRFEYTPMTLTQSGLTIATVQPVS